LGESNYRQLRMHLSGALRLLGELSAIDESPSADGDLKAETTDAVVALTERLRALPPRRETLSIREIPLPKLNLCGAFFRVAGRSANRWRMWLRLHNIVSV
jgi:hypothetical protein